MVGLIFACGFALFLLCLFFYCLGYFRAYKFWEGVVDGEKLSQTARNKIAGIYEDKAQAETSRW